MQKIFVLIGCMLSLEVYTSDSPAIIRRNANERRDLIKMIYLFATDVSMKQDKTQEELRILYKYWRENDVYSRKNDILRFRDSKVKDYHESKFKGHHDSFVKIWKRCRTLALALDRDPRNTLAPLENIVPVPEYPVQQNTVARVAFGPVRGNECQLPVFFPFCGIMPTFVVAMPKVSVVAAMPKVSVGVCTGDRSHVEKQCLPNGLFEECD